VKGAIMDAEIRWTNGEGYKCHAQREPNTDYIVMRIAKNQALPITLIIPDAMVLVRVLNRLIEK
jgi:hypothetical protein